MRHDRKTIDAAFNALLAAIAQRDMDQWRRDHNTHGGSGRLDEETDAVIEAAVSLFKETPPEVFEGEGTRCASEN